MQMMYVRPFVRSYLCFSVSLSVSVRHCLFSLAFSRAFVDSLIHCDLTFVHGAVDMVMSHFAQNGRPADRDLPV